MIKYVQQATGLTTVSTGSTVTATWAANTTTGNLIVVAVGTNSTTTTVSSITDSQSNTYTKIDSNTAGPGDVEIWYAKNITGGTTPTITVTGSTTGKFVVAANEYFGADVVSPLDKNANANGNSTATLSTTAATTKNDELVFSVGMNVNAAATYSVGSGYGHLANVTSTGAGTNVTIGIEDKTVSTTGTQAGAMTQSTTGTWGSVTATFKSTINLVQTKERGSSSLTPVGQTLVFPSNVTTGNLILVAVASNVATVSSVTDSLSNTYTLGSAYHYSNYLTYYYAKNITGGACTVTVTFSTTGWPYNAQVREYEGLDTTSPLDVQAQATGSSTAPSATTATTGNANDLVVGIFANTSSNTYTQSTGYDNFTMVNTASTQVLGIQDKTVNATGTQTAAITQSSTSTWGAIAVAFKQGAGGTTLTSTTAGLTTLEAVPTATTAGTADLKVTTPIFDNSADFTFNGVGTSTNSFTVGNNSNRLLVVAFRTNITGNNPTSITYGGTNLTSIGSAANNAETDIWILKAPATGANNLIVTSSTATGDVWVGSYYDVDQTNPYNLGTAVTASSVSTITQTFTPTYTNSLVLQFINSNVGGMTTTLSTGALDATTRLAFTNNSGGQAVLELGRNATALSMTYNFSNTSSLAARPLAINLVQGFTDTSAGLTTLESTSLSTTAGSTRLLSPQVLTHQIDFMSGYWGVSSGTTYSNAPGIWHYDAASYQGQLEAYMEVTATVSSATGTGFYRLYDLTTAAAVGDASAAISFSTAQNSLLTARDNYDYAPYLVDGHDYCIQAGGDATGTTTSVYASRIILQQHTPIGSISATESWINISNGLGGATNTSQADVPDSPIIYWDGTKYDGTIATYLEFTTTAGQALSTAQLQLYDITASAVVSGSNTTVTAGTGDKRTRSTAFTLVSGHEYKLQSAVIANGATSPSYWIYGANIVVKQTGTITKYQSIRLIEAKDITTTSSGNVATPGSIYYKGLTDYAQYVNIISSFYEVTFKNSLGTATTVARPYDRDRTYFITPGDIQTSSTAYTRGRSSTFEALTTIGSGDFLTNTIQSDGTNTATVTGGRYIFNVSLGSTVGRDVSAGITPLEDTTLDTAAGSTTLETSVVSTTAGLVTLEGIPTSTTAGLTSLEAGGILGTTAGLNSLEATTASTTAGNTDFNNTATTGFGTTAGLVDFNYPIGVLYDLFPGTSLSAKWSTFGANQTVTTNNELIITTTASTSGFGGIQAALNYNLTGSSIQTRIDSAGTQATTFEFYTPILKLDASNNVSFDVINSVLTAYKKIANSVTSLGTVAYSTSTQYTRIRESAGTVYWDYSADGLTWTNLASQIVSSQLFDIRNLIVQIESGNNASAGANTSKTFDVNNLVAINTSAGATNLEPTKASATAGNATLETTQFATAAGLTTLETTSQFSTTAALTNLETITPSTTAGNVTLETAPQFSTTAGLTNLETTAFSATAGLNTLEATVLSTTSGLTNAEATKLNTTAALTSLEATTLSTSAGNGTLETTVFSTSGGLTTLETTSQFNTAAGLTTFEAVPVSTTAGLTTLENTLTSTTAGLTNLASTTLSTTAGLTTLEAINIFSTTAGLSTLELTNVLSTSAGLTTLEPTALSATAGLNLLEATTPSTTAGLVTLDGGFFSTNAGLNTLESTTLATSAGQTTLETTSQFSTTAGLNNLEPTKVSTSAGLNSLESTTLATSAGNSTLELTNVLSTTAGVTTLEQTNVLNTIAGNATLESTNIFSTTAANATLEAPQVATTAGNVTLEKTQFATNAGNSTLETTLFSTTAGNSTLESTSRATSAGLADLQYEVLNTTVGLTTLEATAFSATAGNATLDSGFVSASAGLNTLEAAKVDTSAGSVTLETAPQFSTTAARSNLEATKLNTAAALTTLESTTLNTTAGNSTLEATQFGTTASSVTLEITKFSTAAGLTTLEAINVLNTSAGNTTLEAINIFSTTAGSSTLESTVLSTTAGLTNFERTSFSTVAALTNLEATVVSTTAGLINLESTTLATTAGQTTIEPTSLSTTAGNVSLQSPDQFTTTAALTTLEASNIFSATAGLVVLEAINILNTSGAITTLEKPSVSTSAATTYLEFEVRSTTAGFTTLESTTLSATAGQTQLDHFSLSTSAGTIDFLPSFPGVSTTAGFIRLTAPISDSQFTGKQTGATIAPAVTAITFAPTHDDQTIKATRRDDLFS
jgi:hypothetical protein